MNKLLQWFDTNILKFIVIGTLIFTTLYPKLPSIQITHTWVYIRLEDFAIAMCVGLWLIQVLRRKVKLALPIGIPIFLYWIVGLVSLIFCLIFIAPTLANFFPKIAVLQYFRRIEYMILFFVAFSTIKSIKDVRDYIIGLVVAVIGVIIYGLGQHFYLDLWHQFPQFFEKYPFCFPAFETGNEEFAKGIPLCLPVGARTTSTFGGHYDLAAYLVVILPILLGALLAFRKIIQKIFFGLLYIGGLMVLIFTSSRTSFATYLVGVIAALLFLGKKKLILPVLVLSIGLLLIFSSSTAQRFLETIRFTSVVTNSQGQVVGVAQNTLPSNLQKRIAKNSFVISEEAPSQNLPVGSSFITLPQAPVATNVAVIKNKLDPKEAERLKLAYGGLEISTISGSFLIQKALVYDISFTTRFQAEWPRDFAAFLRSPVFGTGYSSLTLASDNDYLRSLGETGFLGLLSFLGIFAIFGIYLKQTKDHVENTLAKYFALGLAGGVVGLFANAILIDVFEASKVAEPLWILLGVGVGALAIAKKPKVQYAQELWKLLTSHIMLCVDLLILTLVFFGKSVTNYFVADDFTWLRWAAGSTTHSVATYFTNAQGFFYRPLDKTVILFLYTFFSFQPQGYHLFTLFVHFFISVGVYILVMQIVKKKAWAFSAACIFLLMPSHPENIFWISTISTNLSSLFLLFSVIAFIHSQRRKFFLWYPVSIVLALSGLFSYEMAVIAPLLIVLALVTILKITSLRKIFLFTLLYILCDGIYLFIRSKAHVVAIGGDYAYNLVHLVPNVLGNFSGYLFYFILGDTTLSWYTLLRTHARQFALPFGIIVSLITVLLLWGIWKLRKRLSGNGNILLFGIFWIIIGLLPFLGLGNLSPRYGYFASIGFSIAMTVIFAWILSLHVVKEKYKKAIIIGAILLLAFWSWTQNTRQNDQWNNAGKITYTALGVFKIEEPVLPPGAVIFVVNIPIKQVNAWVFPVGFEDGLWFIYRQYLPPVIKASTLQQAKIQAKDYEYPYIFMFDKNGKISEIK